MNKNNIDKPGVKFLRESSDRLVNTRIERLRAAIQDALTEFGCMSPEEGSPDWFHGEGKAVLNQLASQDPRSGWPMWVWDRCLNEILAEAESKVRGNNDLKQSSYAFSPAGFARSSINTEVRLEGDTIQATVYFTHGEILGAGHVQITGVEDGAGQQVEGLSDRDLQIIRAEVSRHLREAAD